jgi:glycosyltransferase involved in cell wall biosynthesis
MLFVKQYLSDQRVMRSAGAPQSPVVSVILPTYARHAGGRLRRAVESVLSQSFADFELIVVDDGSTDGSHDFIERCRAADPRVVNVRHERNSGLPALRVNEGIELARGRFLAFQFDDDSWRPDALAALLRGAERHRGPAVIVGRCHARGRTLQGYFPDREPEPSAFFETNFIANNSVLVPRLIVERRGMYDCHIAMRRICDWDLWIRYIRHYPFHVVEEVVSDVEAELPDSVGMTMPHDLPLIRFFQSVRRDQLLTLARWREYEVDGLRVGEAEIEGEFRRRLYEDQIVPYYLRHRHHFPQIENFPATLPSRRRSVLYTSEDHKDVFYETLLSHDGVSNRRGGYKMYCQLTPQITPGWERDADILLLGRSSRENAKELLAQALADDKPAGYFLDDDLLTLHEYGPEFDFLAPGAPARKNLTEILKGVDAVWVTTRPIGESVGPLNPRTVPYEGSIPQESLPNALRTRDEGRPLRVGCTSGDYRQRELGHLWEALSRFSREQGEKVVFEFWGVEVSSLPPLASPVIERPFINSYARYLERLREAEFDVLLAPLMGRPRARLAKAPNKYYLAAAAGALGIFSDVRPYEMLPGGLTCLKADNSVEGWHAALREAAGMPAARFDLMRRRMLEHVREEFTEAAVINTHEAALRATEFHGRTRAKRFADGRPRVLLYLPAVGWKGDEDSLRRRVELMRSHGVEPVVIFHPAQRRAAASEDFSDALARTGVESAILFELPALSEASGRELRAILERHAPALVHSFAFLTALGKLCREMHIPHVASPEGIGDGLLWEANFRYCDVSQSDTLLSADRLSRLFGVGRFCARGPVARELFDLGLRRHLDALGCEPPSSTSEPLRLVAVGPFRDDVGQFDGAGQFKAVEVLGRLSRKALECRLDLYADAAARPDRAEEWRGLARSLGVAHNFAVHEYEGDDAAIFQNADVLLNVSECGDFPHAFKAAMASGVLVLTAPAGGISELVIDGVSGILCAGASVEEMARGVERAIMLGRDGRGAIVEQARRVARSEFHPSRAANDLFWTYNRAVEVAGAARPTRADEGRAFEPDTAACGLGEPPPQPAASHVLVSNKLQFRLVPRRENWIGLDVLVGTHMRAAQGSLRLRVRSPSGELLREASEDLAEVDDNEWVSFRFPAIPDTARKTFIAEFGLGARDAHTRVSLYENSPPENRVRRLLRRAVARSPRQSLHCRMWYAG